MRPILAALAFLLATPLSAQQGEIFIPGATQQVQPPVPAQPQARTPLGRCLANPGAAACAGVSLDPGGIALESAVPQVQFETLVLDLDAKRVAVSRDAPAQAPDYTAPAKQTGQLALPSVAITIEFDYNSDHIRADQRGKMAGLISALTDPALSGTAYAVIGHTDAAGSFGYNCDLSLRRAISVSRALEGAYVPVPLYAVGFGEHVLKNTYDPRAAENRRVTFLRLPGDPAPVLSTASSVCGY